MSGPRGGTHTPFRDASPGTLQHKANEAVKRGDRDAFVAIAQKLGYTLRQAHWIYSAAL